MRKMDELQKHTLNLFAGDYERIQVLFPERGAGPIIRDIVREFLASVDAKAPEPKLHIRSGL